MRPSNRSRKRRQIETLCVHFAQADAATFADVLP